MHHLSPAGCDALTRSHQTVGQLVTCMGDKKGTCVQLNLLPSGKPYSLVFTCAVSSDRSCPSPCLRCLDMSIVVIPAAPLKLHPVPHQSSGNEHKCVQ